MNDFNISAFVYMLELWAGFACVHLAGSLLHEKVPTKLAAIHAAD